MIYKTLHKKLKIEARKVWRYQRGNQKCKSKRNRQYNDQKKKDKRTNNDLLNTTQKTKDWGKKSLKISKGLLETVNQKTDNTMTKRKSTNNDL